jgi:hypothetical protein
MVYPFGPGMLVCCTYASGVDFTCSPGIDAILPMRRNAHHVQRGVRHSGVFNGSRFGTRTAALSRAKPERLPYRGGRQGNVLPDLPDIPVY